MSSFLKSKSLSFCSMKVQRREVSVLCIFHSPHSISYSAVLLMPPVKSKLRLYLASGGIFLKFFIILFMT
jgi:hypothetical protein